MKISISGAGGFLGQQLLPRLVAMSTDVRAVAYSSQDPATLYQHDRVEYHRRESATDGESMRGVDVLVHCAFPRAADGAALATGLAYNHDVFRSAVRGGVPAIVNISSQSVYSSAREEGATEETPVSLESQYATAKYATELMLDAFSSANTRVSHLRLASLIGPKFDQRVVNKLVRKALFDGELNVLRGRSLFAFMDVRDAADALTSALREKVWNDAAVLNVGAQCTYTLEEIASVVAARVSAATGKTIRISFAGEEEQYSSSELKSDAFQRLTHFEHTWQLETSVDAILEQARVE